MRVIVEVTCPGKGAHHDHAEVKAEVVDIKGLLARDEDFVRSAVEARVRRRWKRR